MPKFRKKPLGLIIVLSASAISLSARAFLVDCYYVKKDEPTSERRNIDHGSAMRRHNRKN